ncbi:MAG: hypothetical protein M3N57_13230 [Actinomycetota bacterium]|nr:hypothetical protein [Actinomycetota bacterium]
MDSPRGQQRPKPHAPHHGLEPSWPTSPPAATVDAQPGGAKTPRDAGNWAKPVGALHVARDSFDGGFNLNVEGKRLAGPVQGFGRMWQKTYRARFGVDVSPEEVIRVWKDRFPEFWPEGNRFFGPLTGIAPGEVAVLNLAMPGRITLSTGVMVVYSDDESFTFMTPEGHMLAAWITFSAYRDGPETVAQVQALLRTQNLMVDLGNVLIGGFKKEDRFWEHTLQQLAGHFSVTAPAVILDAVCVDRKRQWRNALKFRNDAMLRSTFYQLGRSFRRSARSPRG